MTYVLDRELTFEEYLSYDTGDDYRYELVDGRLVRMNPPSPRHVKLAKSLFKRFDAEIDRLDLSLSAHLTMGVRTTPKMVRLPDVMVMTLEQEDGLNPQSAVLEVAPPLVVEIVSPGDQNRERDYEAKLKEYQQIGVAEYWIVDVFEQKVTVALLVGKRYQAQEYEGNSLIQSQLFPKLVLTAQQVLQS